jgi:hydrogenase maturation protein HypF
MTSARSIHIYGVVQGVGFRPFVFRLASSRTLAGWVLNGEDGVEIHLEGAEPALDAFLRELEETPPPAARITGIDVRAAEPAGFSDFSIRESHRQGRPSVRISPDLPVCEECLRELFDPADRRFHYPYINCAHCGPRYTIVQALPYDRPNTTMRAWPLDEPCAAQYGNPADRRFHAQPVSCAACGPRYFLRLGKETAPAGDAAIAKAAELLRSGAIVAVKGLGGYHLVCDAMNAGSLDSLRDRKFRKEKPFAVMAKSLAAARELARITPESEALLLSSARPIVLLPAIRQIEGIAPASGEIGVMLPYTPLHALLFAAGAPDALVMTSANRSSEPIAYQDEDAIGRLSAIADAFLIGERPIARRVDDSVARVGAFGPVILRRARGYAPGAVARLPAGRPILAVGGDLKNTVTLVVEGQAFVSQHIGDLGDYQSFESFRQTIEDLISMYEVRWDDLLVVSDSHPEYVSAMHASKLPAREKQTVQHHRAHIASVLAGSEEWNEPVLGVSFDGTGFGDDGAIWGGEIFEGSVSSGFRRLAHLRYASLPGGDAAAHHPAQAAAGFLSQIDGLPDLTADPFRFPARYEASMRLARNGLRTFPTTSMGRLFDTAAALLGFTRAITFEGQAAMWLEQLARRADAQDSYPLPFNGDELDFRPLLLAIVKDRLRGREPAAIARAFQRGIAQGLFHALRTLSAATGIASVVLSGGVFQNELLLEDIRSLSEDVKLRILTNHAVPPNDGGISLGQAALAALGQFDHSHA